MKKYIKLTLITLMIMTTILIPHVHDENCGYNPETGLGCIYEEVIPLIDEGPNN